MKPRCPCLMTPRQSTQSAPCPTQRGCSAGPAFKKLPARICSRISRSVTASYLHKCLAMHPCFLRPSSVLPPSFILPPIFTFPSSFLLPSSFFPPSSSFLPPFLILPSSFLPPHACVPDERNLRCAHRTHRRQSTAERWRHKYTTERWRAWHRSRHIAQSPPARGSISPPCTRVSPQFVLLAPVLPPTPVPSSSVALTHTDGVGRGWQ